MKALSFSERLRVAAQYLTTERSELPGFLRDQVDAARDETREWLNRLGSLLPLVEPDQTWSGVKEMDVPLNGRALLLAGVLDCLPNACLHLRKDGPQPAFVRLPLHRMDCVKCARTVRIPPAEDADRCDLCGAHGIDTFIPITVQNGPMMVLGDVCQGCASYLNIPIQGAA